MKRSVDVMWHQSNNT